MVKAPIEEIISLDSKEFMPSIEIPLQQMFDEFLVFVSKSDFE